MAEESATLSTELYNKLLYLAGQLVQADGIVKKEKLVGSWINDLDEKTRHTMIHTIIKNSQENANLARVFLIMLNYHAMIKYMPKEVWEASIKRMLGNGEMDRSGDVLQKLSKTTATQANILRTKTAMMLQILYLLADRLEEAGLPKCKLTSHDCLDYALSGDISNRAMVIKMEPFGANTYNHLEEILAEADFQREDKTTYKLQISDSLIKQYSEGRGLESATKASQEGGGMTDRLAEGMVIRMGMNIVKRFAMMFRTITMYPPDHPGVAPLITSILSTLNGALIEREHITLTLLGGKLLVDEIQIKKESKALKDYIMALEERNITSVTFNRGITEGEIKNFCLMFKLTEKQIKDQGGVKTILEKKGVTHILSDQFKYGVVSMDKDAEKLEQVSGDEKMLENIIYTDFMQKLKEGEGLEDMASSDMGEAFRKMIQGDGKGKNLRKTLARMVVALDPGLIDKAIFEEEGLRDELSWSAARKMVDELVVNLNIENSSERKYAVETLGKMMSVAIARNKDTTLKMVIDKLSARFTKGETDVEVSVAIMETLTDICRKLILQYKFSEALKIIHLFREILIRTKYGTAAAANLDDRIKVLQGLCVTAISQLAEDEVMDCVVEGLKSDSKETVENCTEIIKKLGSEKVVEKLLDIFLDDNRTIRNRAYNILVKLRDLSQRAIDYKLQSSNDATVFPRASEAGMLTDEGWYVMRNAIDILGEIKAENAEEMITALLDDKDPRVRKEALTILAKMNSPKLPELTAELLNDPDEGVLSKAISVLGSPGAQSVVPRLLDLFFEKPEQRVPVINTLGKIGGDEVITFLLNAITSKNAALKKIFNNDDKLRKAALVVLGKVGNQDTIRFLKKFVGHWQSPITKLFNVFNQNNRRITKDILPVALESLAHLEHRFHA